MNGDASTVGAPDVYMANAEWYGALVVPGLPAMHSALRQLIGTLDGDVVELGAGIGSCVSVLVAGGAERIFAVEPSPSMRVGLMSTIAADPDLLRRTTIVAAGIPEALDELPSRWGGVVMLNAIGHLEDAARLELWAALRERLTAGAPFVVSLQHPERPIRIAWTDFGTVKVGERSVRTRARAEPIDAHHVAWTMEWSLLDAGGAVLDRRSAVSRWRTQSVGELVEEAALFDFAPVDSVPEVGAYAFRSS